MVFKAWTGYENWIVTLIQVTRFLQASAKWCYEDYTPYKHQFWRHLFLDCLLKACKVVTFLITSCIPLRQQTETGTSLTELYCLATMTLWGKYFFALKYFVENTHRLQQQQQRGTNIIHHIHKHSDRCTKHRSSPSAVLSWQVFIINF